jgi:hypothetical protein
VLAHLPGDLGENVVAPIHADAERHARQGFDDLTFDLDLFLFDSRCENSLGLPHT